jgi:two-component system cell cycle response regulator
VSGLGFRRGTVVDGRQHRLPELGTGPVLRPALEGDLATQLPDGRDVVLLPLSMPGTPGAVMVLEQGARGRWRRIDGDVLAAAEQLASATALAMANKRMVEEMRRLASTDGLTGLANRRTFDEALDREVSRARRARTDLALVLVDVDHFKRVNDTRGHAFGDEVLRQVAGRVAAAVRPYDVAARYGGEELAVILPGCSLDEAVHVAERLRADVAALRLGMPVTVSAGVASLPPETNGSDLVASADAALYRAKAGGRDRVEASGPPRHRRARGELRLVG